MARKGVARKRRGLATREHIYLERITTIAMALRREAPLACCNALELYQFKSKPKASTSETEELKFHLGTFPIGVRELSLSRERFFERHSRSSPSSMTR